MLSYTQAIDHAPLDDNSFVRDVYRKRAYANLTGRRFDVALKDALASSLGNTHDDKAYHCAGRAAYELSLYEEAKNYFETALVSSPKDSKYMKEYLRTKVEEISISKLVSVLY